MVVQDVRGKFRSGGIRDPFVNEAADGSATLDWIVEQSWSSGSVGMLGDSYYGFTQWAAASTRHPALKAIVPRVTGTHLPDMFSRPRIPLFEWLVHAFSVSGMLEHPVASLDDQPRYTVPDAVADEVARITDALVSGASDGSLFERSFVGGPPAPQLHIPALHMGGWWDNLQRPQLDDWQDATRSPAAQHQYLRMNAIDHEDFEWHEFGTPHHDHEADDAALNRYLPRMLDEPISFLDHYLNDRPGPWLAPKVRYMVANADWHVGSQWPPLDVQTVALSLSHVDQALHGAAGAQLSLDAPDEESNVMWVHEPRDPVPYLPETEWGCCLTCQTSSSCMVGLMSPRSRRRQPRAGTT